MDGLSFDVVSMMSQFRPVMTNASVFLMCVVLTMAARLLWGARQFSGVHKRRVLFLSAGLGATSLIFFHQVWAVWGLFLVVGWLLAAISVASQSKHEKSPSSSKWLGPALYARGSASLSIVFILASLAGVVSGYAPMISAGPSMWPASPKGVSVHILNTNAYKKSEPTYGDDIDFVVPIFSYTNHEGRVIENKVPELSVWSAGRFRKRIWALPGDQLRVGGEHVFLNEKVIADCTDTSRRLSSKAWLCTVRWPNGKSADIVWGWSNVLYQSIATQNLKPGAIFAMGDNTLESTDSRDRGPIDRSWIDGRYDGQFDRPVDKNDWREWGYEQ